jgi:Clp amino terminal domain, pathogenicity island component
VNQAFTFERFTESARRALFHARVAVSEHGGTAIIDAHLLLGLLKAVPELGLLMRPGVSIQQLSECLIGAVAVLQQPQSIAAGCLRSAGIDLRATAAAVVKFVGGGV